MRRLEGGESTAPANRIPAALLQRRGWEAPGAPSAPSPLPSGRHPSPPAPPASGGWQRGPPRPRAAALWPLAAARLYGMGGRRGDDAGGGGQEGGREGRARDGWCRRCRAVPRCAAGCRRRPSAASSRPPRRRHGRGGDLQRRVSGAGPGRPSSPRRWRRRGEEAPRGAPAVPYRCGLCLPVSCRRCRVSPQPVPAGALLAARAGAGAAPRGDRPGWAPASPSGPAGSLPRGAAAPRSCSASSLSRRTGPPSAIFPAAGSGGRPRLPRRCTGAGGLRGDFAARSPQAPCPRCFPLGMRASSFLARLLQLHTCLCVCARLLLPSLLWQICARSYCHLPFLCTPEASVHMPVHTAAPAFLRLCKSPCT